MGVGEVVVSVGRDGDGDGDRTRGKRSRAESVAVQVGRRCRTEGIYRTDLAHGGKPREGRWRIEGAYITKKQLHCTPTWATPNRPAAQANGLISLQHPTSSARRQDEDVRDGAGAARGAEQNEVGRQTFAGPSAEDAVVLREVGQEEADEDDSGGKGSDRGLRRWDNLGERRGGMERRGDEWEWEWDVHGDDEVGYVWRAEVIAAVVVERHIHDDDGEAIDVLRRQTSLETKTTAVAKSDGLCHRSSCSLQHDVASPS